jgi:hypothetical protein
MDKPDAVGRTEDVGLDNIGHLRGEVEVVEVVVRIGKVGS